MEDEFHELVSTGVVADSTQLQNPRARELANAVATHRDFSLVRLLRREDRTFKNLEILVVDVECDGVPSQNPYGIQFRERLAFCVPEDDQLLIRVLALRKDFPLLPHQNGTFVGDPADLCLYYEPPLAVRRTWTAQSFLRRVQYWLEKSARNELHAADQPIEQLFFIATHALVLPWNFSDLRRVPGQRFAIGIKHERQDGAKTLLLFPAESADIPGNRITPIEVTVPPVLHGHVENNPRSLGELADLLSAKGIDFLSILREAVQEGVGEAGLPAKGDTQFCIVILHVPLMRHPGAEPERTMVRAFLLGGGRLHLGELIGALFKLDNRYYREQMTGALGHQPEVVWRAEVLDPLDVQTAIDPVAARAQSGISDLGPDAVLVGAGALGSAMLNLWGRSGWGRWTVIDKDHIKPHNLVRHEADARHIGVSKAAVASALHEDVAQGASEVRPICANAHDHLSEGHDSNVLREAALVIDASTTLEYPRAASSADAVARHISVFITPSGNGSVLLAEDAERRIRLRTLEAQYYRAVINDSWGLDHLSGNLGTYWSGASCRDISTVLPYSRVIAHASTLAEQVQVAFARPDPLIRVWTRDATKGQVVAHDVRAYAERRFALEALALFIDEALIDKLRTMRRSVLPAETGGVLLGYYDFNIRAVILVDSLPAPPDSVSTTSSFERGISGLSDTVKEASRRTAGVVGYVGEWHSHPPGHSAKPSRDDLFQLVFLSLGMADEGLGAISLIVGERDIQVLQGRVR